MKRQLYGRMEDELLSFKLTRAKGVLILSLCVQRKDPENNWYQVVGKIDDKGELPRL